MARRKYRRSYKPRTSTSYSACGKKLYKDGMNLYKLVKPFLPFNVEYKRITSGAAVNPSTTAAAVLLNGVAQGDNSAQRSGSQIRMSSVGGIINAEINTSAVSTTIRWALVQDLESHGSAIDLAADGYHSTAYTLTSLPNPDYQGRFKTLKTGFINLANSGVRQVAFRVYCKFPALTSASAKERAHVEYIGATAATSSIGKNGLFFIYVCNELTNTPTLTYNLRMNYLDN